MLPALLVSFSSLSACREASPVDPTRCSDAPTGCDLDGDGHADLHGGGDDCNDEDATVYPGAEETPYDDIDQDCSGADRDDVDGDGFAGLEAQGLDCDDTDASRYPGAIDALGDSEDTDCDGHLELISTLAGTGEAGAWTGGGVATELPLTRMLSIAVAEDRSVYLGVEGAEYPLSAQILKVTPAGQIASMVGSVGSTSQGSSIPASELYLSTPNGIALDAQGRLYISDTYAYRVWRIDLDGMARGVAGDGYAGSGGDGGPATSARLAQPSGIDLGPDGSLYIADQAAHVIRKVSTTGIIQTIAGTGLEGFSGDGGLATLAALNQPSDVAVDATGRVYISDSGNRRVRRLELDGTLQTVAGNGETGKAADGVDARSVALDAPAGIDLDPAGRLYICVELNNWVRQVDLDGAIRTVIGIPGTQYNGGYSGDGGAPTRAELYLPEDLALDARGGVYVADSGNFVVRAVDP